MMDSTEENDVEDLCRLCLGQAETKISIFKDDFPKMIKIVSNIVIDPSDDLPKNSCLTCAKEVKSAVLLRGRILRSQKYLKAKLSKAKSKKNVHYLNGTSPDIEQIVIITEPGNYLDESEENNQLKEELESGDFEQSNEGNVHENSEGPNNYLGESYNQAFPHIESDQSEYLDKDGDSREPTEGTIYIEQEPPISSHNNLRILQQITVGKRKPKPRNSNYSPQTCSICKKVFSNMAYMKMHLRTHNGPVDCPICGKTYNYRDSMNQHILYYHKQTSGSIVCDICGRNFRKNNIYILHMKRHLNRKDVECPTCGKMFYSSLLLSRHVKQVHTKIQPYICEYCSKSFSRRDQLKIHIRTHSAETPFSCSVCNHKFKQKSCLKYHLRNKHQIEDEITVQCPKCDKGFSTQQAFTSHFSRVHEEERCTLCPSAFTSEDSLKEHIQKVHAKEYKEMVKELG